MRNRRGDGDGAAMTGFWQEARRRSVIRVGGLYLTGSWLLMQVADTVFPVLEAPAWIARTLLLVLAVGFVPALALAWAFEWTPAGLVRDRDAAADPGKARHVARRLDRWIMVLLALGIAYFAFDKFLLAPGREAAATREARLEGRSEAIRQTFGERSIAVLPFVDMSAGHDQQYLADGVSEQILNLLGGVPELRVISRASASIFRERAVPLPEIAKKLDVGYILDGSIRRDGDRVRVTVQLIDGRSDTQLWNDTYDRLMDDIFAIQDMVARAVVGQLKIKLLGGTPVTRNRTSGANYDLYLRAMDMDVHDATDSQRQVAMLDKVLEADPDYAAAWGGLAVAHTIAASFGWTDATEGYAKARNAANRALRIDPAYSQALTVLADITLRQDGDLAIAAALMQRSLATGRYTLNDLNIAEDIAKALGRLDEAVAINQHIVARDPLEGIAHSQLGIAYLQAGRLDDAIRASRVALSLDPRQPVTHSIISSALLLKGDAAAALAEAQDEPFEPFRLFQQAMALHTLGRHAESDAVLAKIIASYERDAAFNIAYVEAWRGNRDSAFAWLDKAVQYQDSALPMLPVDPLFASLHGDPRWKALLQRLGKSPEQLARIEFKVPLGSPDADAASPSDAAAPTPWSAPAASRGSTH